MTVPRLAIPRPLEHPLARVAWDVGWEPVYYPITVKIPTGAPPPLDPSRVTALILLSPDSALAAKPWIHQDTEFLVQDPLTAEALGSGFPRVQVAPKPNAEGVWDLLTTRFPKGGEFLLGRTERSRGFLEESAAVTHWRLFPWFTHREVPVKPFPVLPPVQALLALSPVQVGLLVEVSRGLTRFAWGDQTAKAFEAAGVPPHGVCEERVEALRTMLRDHRTRWKP